MSQLALFDQPPVAKTCGNCVMRNAVNERQPTGHCAAAGCDRCRDDPACDRWFGMEQLRAPLYGGKRNG